jgi:hypothetical protein
VFHAVSCICLMNSAFCNSCVGPLTAILWLLLSRSFFNVLKGRGFVRGIVRRRACAAAGALRGLVVEAAQPAAPHLLPQARRGRPGPGSRRRGGLARDAVRRPRGNGPRVCEARRVPPNGRVAPRRGTAQVSWHWRRRRTRKSGHARRRESLDEKEPVLRSFGTLMRSN